MGKKAARGSGMIRQRKDGTWEGRITVGRDPGTGKQKTKSIYGKTQSEVRKKMTVVIASLDQGSYVEPSKMTLQTWMNTWLAEYTGGIKENTLVSYRIQSEHNLLPLLGAVKLSALQPHHIQKTVNTLFKRPEKPLSAKSVKNCYGVLHKALSQAVLNGYIAKNPCDGVQLPRVEKKEISPLNEAEIRAFLQTIKGHRNEILFRVALFTGMRQGELMGLQWENVDFITGSILVCQQMIHEKKKGGIYKIASTKTDGIRKIAPAPIVMDWLKAWKKEQAAQRLALGDKWGDEFDGLVFTDEMGKHMKNATLTHEATMIGKKIGKAGFRFHDLRHSYAVAAIRAGDDMKTVSSNLGHASITITMDIYASFTDDMAIASARRMDDYMRRISSL